MRGFLCHPCTRGGDPDDIPSLEARITYLKDWPSWHAWANLTEGQRTP